MPHLTALAILHAGCGEAQDGDTVPVTAPAEAAGPIDQLRASGVTLTYDPDTRSIRTGDSDGVAVTAGRDHCCCRNDTSGGITAGKARAAAEDWARVTTPHARFGKS